MTRCILIPLVVGLGMAGVAPEVQLDVPFLRQKKNGCGAAIQARISKETSGKRTWHTSRRGEWPCVRDCCDYTRALISD